jgi:hypothetical protein
MRRLFIALGIAAVLAAAVYGAAASLGGITGNTSLGADDTVVSSCDTDGVAISMTTQPGGNTFESKFRVSDLVISGIADACLGKEAKLFFTKFGQNFSPGGNGSYSVVVQARAQPLANDNIATYSFVLTSAPPVEDVEDVHVQIGS